MFLRSFDYLRTEVHGGFIEVGAGGGGVSSWRIERFGMETKCVIWLNLFMYD